MPSTELANPTPRSVPGDRSRPPTRICRVGELARIAAPRTPLGDRTRLTRRTTSTYRRAEVHQRLVVLPRSTWRNRRIGQRLRLASRQPPPRHPREHPCDAGVDHAGVDLERKYLHRSRQVGTDARQRQQGVEVLGQRGRQIARPPHRPRDAGFRARRGYPNPDHSTSTSDRPAAASDAGVAQRSRNRSHRGITRSTWVCCSITSATRIANGSRVRRHGRSRRTTSPQLNNASRAGPRDRSRPRPYPQRRGARSVGSAPRSPRHLANHVRSHRRRNRHRLRLRRRRRGDRTPRRHRARRPSGPRA